LPPIPAPLLLALATIASLMRCGVHQPGDDDALGVVEPEGVLVEETDAETEGVCVRLREGDG
jgi:hypothetical protein